MLIDYPAEVLPLLDFTLNEFFADAYPEDDLRGDSLMVGCMQGTVIFAKWCDDI